MKVVGSNGWQSKIIGSKSLNNEGYGSCGCICQPLDVDMARSTTG